jgi:cysteine synthase A
MPETMSVERQAQKIANELPGAVILDQFRNPANPEIHRRTTAMEIWQDTQGEVDSFVSATGTGGTITGVGEVLKQKRPGVRIIGVEPANAAILSGGPVGNHQIPGIGVGFVPDVLNRSILDDVIAVTDEHGFSCLRRLAREAGIIAGVSSGAAVHAALAIAARQRREDHRGDSSRHGRKVYQHELVFRRSGAASAMNSPGRIRRN